MSSSIGKIKQSDNIFALKIKTESNGLGMLKTLIVLFLIALQAALLVLSYLFFFRVFQWYSILSLVLTLITCIYVLSSDYHGQAKATWILFLLFCYSFGYVMFLLSDKRILLNKPKKRYKNIYNTTYKLQKQIDLSTIKNRDIRTNCQYLYNAGNFVAHTNCKNKYYPSGALLFDDILQDMQNAKHFIFIEFFIIANGVLLNRMLDILKEKAQNGVDVRIIYDDMGSHRTLKHKTKKQIKKAGIKLASYNKLIPIFNIALNLRDHRKIVIIDGKIAYTGGTNLADEYINEKRMHGYWKDCGIKTEGTAVDNFTLAYLSTWQIITNDKIDYVNYINKSELTYDNKNITVPFVSGPNYEYSIAQNMYANLISNATKKLYIMTPYFIPDETINNLIINKARSGVDVRIILPDIADKKFVYIVSRNNAEKLIDCGVKVYTMKYSFVHSKIILTENMCIVGSINVDLRSFNQQYESAIYTNDNTICDDVNLDFFNTLKNCEEITNKNKKRNKVSHRILAGLFNLISTFM